MKTKLGISVALMAAATYLLGLFSGYLALVLVVGYILLCETEEWLKKSAVKALAICLVFSVASAVIGLIPNAIGITDDLVSIFGGSFNILFISRIVTFINSLLSVLQKLLLLCLAVLALDTKTIRLPVVDDFIEKHM